MTDDERKAFDKHIQGNRTEMEQNPRRPFRNLADELGEVLEKKELK